MNLKKLCRILFLLFPTLLWSKDILLTGNRLLFFSTNLRTLKHSQFEIGFISQKHAFGTNYHTYVTPYLFKATTYEDTIDSHRAHIRTNIGALGVKFGLIVPINEDEPLYTQIGMGMAKLNVQDNPFFGKIEDSLLKVTRWALHIGVIYNADNLLTRIEYTLSSKDFVDNDFLISIGTSF